VAGIIVGNQHVVGLGGGCLERLPRSRRSIEAWRDKIVEAVYVVDFHWPGVTALVIGPVLYVLCRYGSEAKHRKRKYRQK
jgi:hypothetical protein